ncbi:MAG: hypothetical protein IT161_12485 [Bryobacterales bacterium]|nr:hypothetical protein [Bryobacterales bacterium]
MSDFLEGYGVADARRGRIIKRLILSVLGATAIGIILYFQFRNFGEERQASRFLSLLKKQDYQAAYRLWGCTPETPCRDYAYEKFLEDWGPKSPHADLSNLKVERTRSCDGGIIQILDFGKGDKVNLYVQRKDHVIGFAPWEFCNPRWQAPQP